MAKSFGPGDGWIEGETFCIYVHTFRVMKRIKKKSCCCAFFERTVGFGARAYIGAVDANSCDAAPSRRTQTTCAIRVICVNFLFGQVFFFFSYFLGAMLLLFEY